MLAITPEAGKVLKTALDAAGSPMTAFRISLGPNVGSASDVRTLSLDVVDQPNDEDAVVTAPGGASVVLDPDVVPLLDRKTLDATIDAEGRSSLTLVNS